MIKEIMMYTVICDNCKRDCLENSEFSGFNDKTYVKDIAMESDWIEHENCNYCPQCFSYNDEDDIVIDKSRFNLTQQQ